MLNWLKNSLACCGHLTAVCFLQQTWIFINYLLFFKRNTIFAAISVLMSNQFDSYEKTSQLLFSSRTCLSMLQ